MNSFKPHFSITPSISDNLKRIEAIKENIAHLPLTPIVLASLRETAKLYTTHYSTMIEGNRLTPEEVKAVLQQKGHFHGRERDEREVRGYYAALQYLEEWQMNHTIINEECIQMSHALVMANGQTKVRPTPYRDGQNVIRDGRSGRLVYLPPQPQDVPVLMREFVAWIKSNTSKLPCPIIAGIAHYQFATIHPYFDGNGRTARLLTTLILHLGDYDLKGLYSLEEYYAKNLPAYYDAISIGPSHNYYEGRAESDITPWLDYFVDGMAIACENVVRNMNAAQFRGEVDQSRLLRTLDPLQRKALELFQSFEAVTSRQIGELFDFKSQAAATLCKKWVDSGFLEIFTPSKKTRRYKLAQKYKPLINPI